MDACDVTGVTVSTMDGKRQDRSSVERYFDDLAQREWDRLEATIAGRVSFEIHRRFLARFVEPGMRVLELGAGPGRFTIELVGMGAQVFVSDISQVQLELNARYVAEAGCEGGVVDRRRLDVCDLSNVASQSFDLVLAYGGVLGYVFDQAPLALAEMLRVARHGAPLVASVVSPAGVLRQSLRFFSPTIEALGLETFERFLNSKDLRLLTAAGAHPCQMLGLADIEAMVGAAGAEVVAASASNWLSMERADVVEQLEGCPDLWVRFLDWEERLCAQPGAAEGGTHLLFAATAVKRIARRTP
jgi:SAM-dependent methyltransferase